EPGFNNEYKEIFELESETVEIETKLNKVPMCSQEIEESESESETCESEMNIKRGKGRPKKSKTGLMNGKRPSKMYTWH
ncbi:unnamed protein product, partial [Ceratitis capitata]